jgi:hypothetical protein
MKVSVITNQVTRVMIQDGSITVTSSWFLEDAVTHGVTSQGHNFNKEDPRNQPGPPVRGIKKLVVSALKKILGPSGTFNTMSMRIRGSDPVGLLASGEKVMRVLKSMSVCDNLH